MNGVAGALPNGTPVTRWDDRGQGARNLTRTDAATGERPVVRDDSSTSGPAIAFDGDDYIWASQGDIGRLGSARTILAVARVAVDLDDP